MHHGAQTDEYYLDIPTPRIAKIKHGTMIKYSKKILKKIKIQILIEINILMIDF